jgi:hypothetical protein
VLSQIPSEDVEQLFYSPNELGMVVLCKSVGMDWHRAEVIISTTPLGEKYEQPQIDELHEQFETLSAASAQRLLRFWQGRQAVIRTIARKSG